MGAVDRLYKKNNKTIQKCINLEDKLYDKLKIMIEKDYDATISDMINVSVEDYIDRNKPTFYGKPKDETVTYRSIMIREENLKGLQKFHDKTGISITRLLNGAVKEFLEQNR